MKLSRYECRNVCMYVCMSVCMYVCMHVRLCVCVCIHIMQCLVQALRGTAWNAAVPLRSMLNFVDIAC